MAEPTMDARGRQIGANEAVFRAVNEEIEGLTRGLAEVSDRTLHIVCECADLMCTQTIVVPLADYERIRGEAKLFFLKPGHEKPSVERVVEAGKHHLVVEKTDPDAANVAEETDPRGAPS